MFPKFILVSTNRDPMSGTFVYGMVGNHSDLFRTFEKQFGYAKVHGGGWYVKDDTERTITLYGSSGDYGSPRLAFLNRIPRELYGYRFLYTPSLSIPPNELSMEDIQWI